MPYYKYVTPARVDVIKSLKIRYTQVSALNDPFEDLPAIESSDNNLAKEAAFQARIRAISDSCTGMLSLSKTPSNILMWSHYAASHTGFVIEFDSGHPYFKYGTDEVKYSYVRPRMRLAYGEHHTTLAYTKSMDWKYEREVRKIEPLHDRIHELPNGHSIIEADPNAKEDPSKIHLRELPKDLITGIILGWKSTQRLRDEMKEALRQNGMEKIQVSAAEPCRKDYKMRIVPAHYVWE